MTLGVQWSECGASLCVSWGGQRSGGCDRGEVTKSTVNVLAGSWGGVGEESDTMMP